MDAQRMRVDTGGFMADGVRRDGTPTGYIRMEQEGNMNREELIDLIEENVIPGYYPYVMDRRELQEFQDLRLHTPLPRSGLSSYLWQGIGDNGEALFDIPVVGYAMIPREIVEQEVEDGSLGFETCNHRHSPAKTTRRAAKAELILQAVASPVARPASPKLTQLPD